MTRALAIALVTLAGLVVGCSRMGTTEADASIAAGPSAVAPAATPTPGVESFVSTPSPSPIAATPTPGPRATPTPVPTEGGGISDEPVATLTNPDGPEPSEYPPDEYPFLEVTHALPTYATLWIDDDPRVVHIALTGGVDEAIESIRPLVPRGITVYFHLAAYTNAEVCAASHEIINDRHELTRVGIVISSAGCGNRENRATIGMSPTNPETIAYMRARYDGPLDFEPSGHFGLRPVEPRTLDSLTVSGVRAGDELGLSTCGRRPYPSEALLSDGVDLGSGAPEVAALTEALTIYAEIYGDLSGLEWILAEQDQFGGTFLTDRGDTWLEAQVYAGAKGWGPGMIDYCTPSELALPDGGNAEVYLDPDFPKPRAEDTELHVLVEETACSGASVPYDRLLPPVVRYDADEVRIEVTVRSVGGFSTCPGNPPSPITVLLPEPVGNREVNLPKPPRY